MGQACGKNSSQGKIEARAVANWSKLAESLYEVKHSAKPLVTAKFALLSERLTQRNEVQSHGFEIKNLKINRSSVFHMPIDAEEEEIEYQNAVNQKIMTALIVKEVVGSRDDENTPLSNKSTKASETDELEYAHHVISTEGLTVDPFAYSSAGDAGYYMVEPPVEVKINGVPIKGFSGKNPTGISMPQVLGDTMVSL